MTEQPTDEAFAELNREVHRARRGERGPLTDSELNVFVRRIRPDAECRIELREMGSDGPLIVVRAVRRPPPSRVLESLTVRERDVAKLVARGLTNPAIARELAISPSTVKDHVHSILVRLGFTSRAQLVGAVARELERSVLG